MVQKQLVDYINSQIKLGVDRDAIKGALVGAGWSAVDVDDSLKSIQPGSQSPQSAGPSMISVNSFAPGVGAVAESKQAVKTNPVQPRDIPIANPSHPEHHHYLGYLVLTVIAVALVAASALLYLRYNTLSGQVAVLNGELSSANTNISGLTSRIGDLTQTNGGLTAQVKTLTESNAQSSGELSFFIESPNATGTVSVTLSGALSSSTKGYFLTTADGLKLSLANGSDEKVAAVLGPLVGSTVQIAGTHPPLSRNVTVTAVNGASF